MDQANSQNQAFHAADLVARLARLSQELGESNQHAVEQLQRASQSAPVVLRQAADQAWSGLSSRATESVRQGLQGPLDGLGRHVADSVARIQGVTQLLTQAQQSMQTTVRKLHWLVGSVALVMLLALTAEAGMLWYYRGIIEEHRIQSELMRAYNQADVTLCEGRLCANVERGGKSYQGYVPVKPR
jgi:hypothetical protein